VSEAWVSWSDEPRVRSRGFAVARRGRKRKLGRRHPSGQLVREKQPDDRIRTSRQPHRRQVAKEHRLDERAESPLGRLLLQGRLRAAGELGDEAARDRYEAGMMYAQIVGAYRAVIEAPKSVSGSGRGSACEIAGISESFCEPETCSCLRRKRRYDGAFEALIGRGQRAAKLVARVAVHREEIAPSDLVYLVDGLQALAVHLGLTGPGRREHYRKTQ
jgi:hypothetical protein